MTGKARTAPAARKTPPAGKAHAHCLDHVAHPAGPAGWLCVTTRTEDVSWPRVPLYALPAGYSGPFIPAPAPDVRPVDRAADMVSFADHIARVSAEHRAAELARPIPDGTFPGDTAICHKRGCKVGVNKDGTLHRHPTPHPFPALYTAADRARIDEMAAQLRERTGRTYTGKRAPVVPFVAPAPEPGTAAHLDTSMREFARDMIASGRELGILPGPAPESAPVAEPGPMPPEWYCARCDMLAAIGQPCYGCGSIEPADDAPEPAPDALTRCNACEIETADPDSLAGYCTACLETAPETAAEIAYSAPEPAEPARVRHLQYADRPGFTYCAQVPTADDISAPDHVGALSVLAAVGGFCELCIESCARSLAPEPAPEPIAEPAPEPDRGPWIGGQSGPSVDELIAPAAPVLAAVEDRAPVGRPSCHRCGQTFRKSGNGLAWHLANRPDCAPAQLSAVS